MPRPLAFLLRDSLVYGVAGAANRFAKILLVPVVAKAFPAEVFGAFDTVSLYVYVLAVAGILGLNSSVVIIATRNGSRATPDAMRGPASTSLWLTVGVSLLLALAVLAAPAWWSRVLLDDPSFGPAIAWGAASVPFSAILLYALSLLQWSFRRTWYVAIALGSALLTIALSYVVAFHTSLGLVGLFAANLVGQAVGAAVGLFASRDLIRGAWDRTVARQVLAIGLPFVVIAVASNLVPSIDRIFLVRAHSLADAGIYGLGQKIAALSALVLSGFQAAWGPFAFAQRGEPGREPLFGRVFLGICAASAWLAVVLVVLAPSIARVAATGAYAGAAIFVGPLALSAGLGAVFFVVAIGSVLEGRSLHNLVAYVIGIVVTLAVNAALVRAGTPPVGIAWANCAGQAAAVVCMAALSQRVHRLPYPFVRGAAILVGGGVLALLAGRIADGLPLVAALGVSVALTAALLTGLWFALLAPGDRLRIRARLAAR